jgi:hypothetical protein
MAAIDLAGRFAPKRVSSTPEPAPSNRSANGAPISAVPDFQGDERANAQYTAALQRRIAAFFVEHEASIRRNAAGKRAELRDELQEARSEWERANTAAQAARAAYRRAYPRHVRKTSLEAPSVVDHVRTLGAATALYRAAQDAWLAAERAAGNVRRLEHNDEQLEISLQKALERAPIASKEVTESKKWLAEIHAEGELATLKAKVDAIAAERADYARRLEAGGVSPAELRRRAFAEHHIGPIELPLDGMIFYSVEEFGDDAYFIVRDLGGRFYALPYDRRLEALIDGVYDVVPAGDTYRVCPHAASGGRAFTLLDHFRACHDGLEEAAQAAYHRHQSVMRRRRTPRMPVERDAAEAVAIDVLAGYAAERSKLAASVEPGRPVALRG